MATQAQYEKPNHVFGQVTDTLFRPLPQLIVQVYDRDLRSEELLAETITDREGKYEITWMHSQLSGRGKKEADLSIKVFTKEKKTLLFATDTPNMRFNASPKEVMNITVTRPIAPDAIEYDELMKEITFLANDLAIADLQESKEHQDLSFIAKELDFPAEKIEHLIVAHRLQRQANLDAAFFYALLRKNTLLSNDFLNSGKARLSIGLQTDLQTLLYDAVLTDPEKIRQDMAQAVKERIVGEQVAQESTRYLESLQEYRSKAEEYYKTEHTQKITDTISSFVLGGKWQEAGELFKENKNDLNGFFDKITDTSFLEKAPSVDVSKHQAILKQLLNLDQDTVSWIGRTKNIEQPEDIKQLARLNKKDWVEELSKAKNSSPDDPALRAEASKVVRKLEREFPTTAFAAQLARESKLVLKHQEAIVSFLNQHEDFDLTKDNIDIFLKEKKVELKEQDAVRDELKAVQRVFKLVPHYGKANALRKENIHSAQSIVASGKTRFVKEIAPKAGLDETEANALYKKAENVNIAATLIVGELQDTMRSMDIASMETSTLAMKLEAVSAYFPNLKSLFKTTDACACEHCRSVYSPAAYLVEILQFLDQRSVTDLTVTPAVTSNLAKDVLFERRPDLGEIDLGCENANTPVKYIDLVCELLEEAVAPDPGIAYTGVLSDGPNPMKGKASASLLAALQAAALPVTDQAQVFETEISSGSADALPHYLRDKKAVVKIVSTGGSNYLLYRLRQTLSPADELAAAPEYVNANAYAELSTNPFAFVLPFDLNHVEAKAYFNRFDLSRADLMRDLQVAGSPMDEAIAAEALGLTDTERSLIVTAKPTLTDQQTFWNAPAQWDTPPISGDVLAYMKRVDHFLDKTGLSYAELDLLLALHFIDPDNNLYIKNLDLSCDTGQKEIANLSETALDRIHRFLRLQKKTAWNFDVLDEIISQPALGNGSLNDATLVKAAALLQLSETTGININELIGFYGLIPYQPLNDDAPQPLYQQVFLNKAKNGVIDEGLLPAKVDGSQLLTSFTTSLSVVLQIKPKDLEKLFPLLPDGNLNFANLSYLFAAARLIKKLKLKADDFVLLTRLTNLDISFSPEETLEFVKAAEAFKKSPLKASDVYYMLRHEASVLPVIDDKIKQILERLQKDYQTNFTLGKSRFDDHFSAEELKETLQNELSKLSGIGEEDVKTFLSFIDKTWTAAADAKNFVNTKLGVLFDPTEINNKIDELDSVTTKAQDILDHETALQDLRTAQDDLRRATTPAETAAANAAIAAAEAQLLITLPKYNKATGKNLLKAFLDTIATFQLETGKQIILEQNLTASFKTDEDLIKIVLDNAQLKQPAPGSGSVAVILQSDALIDTNPDHAVPVLPAITEAAFGNQYAALRLLYKVLPLIKAFQLSNEQVTWTFENNSLLDWFEWDSIPYTTGQVPVDYAEYIAFAEIVDLIKSYPPVVNPVDAENPISFLTLASMLLPGSTATRIEFLDALALLTGYEQEDLDALDAHLFPVFDLNNYKDPQNWLKLLNLAETLRTLSSDAAQVLQYTKPVLLAADVSALRAALKARYDEATWLSTLEEITDAIRPQKRNALVAYLLATNPDMKDENDLFDYFLVDVEMEACMPSSRIVQAHGSIQLFVQRCLMGLEPKAAADVDNDINWNQWKWMKNYRVWEANRKVFLYPENWIEADLRDDKSFLFTEFENELQQNELTDFTAEEALIRYVEKLDNIAFLEVMATWYQTDIKTMHVFARTKGGDPALYYYRRFEQERYWTPWEKVELDISGNQLLALERNNRLCLAWLQFGEEPDPNQKATVPPATANATVDVDKPKRKQKIQLVISEFANNKWQPKKISAQGILTPNDYVSSDLPTDKYNMLYFEAAQQVWIFNTTLETNEYHQLNGIFNLTGCKGYPELVFQGSTSFPDFFPDFKDTLLKAQRYNEWNTVPGDELSVRNGISLFQFFDILTKTPGDFRLTYPHQFTYIDMVVLLFEYLLLLVFKGSLSDRRLGLKIPLGTLLPYFMEDSKHAYVIIPGFYDIQEDRTESSPVSVQRTASDVMQLIEDIIALFKKYMAKYQADPAHDVSALVAELLADNEYQAIVAELQVYKGLKYGEQFKNMYHPLVCPLRKTLYRDGIPELMKRETQLQKSAFDFKTYYEPNPAVVVPLLIANEDGTKSLTYPIEDLDFTSDGSYSCYNWELFFHVPFLLATRLTQNQRFEEAMTWFHYMFNPTGALKGNTPQKYWVTKPFYLNQEADYINQRIDTLLYKIADPTTPERIELEFAISEWRDKPFKPHVVARFRPVAYQKALLMKYIDNLTEWGDYLFRQDTMESIAQATQMYILADKLLGPKPRTIPQVVKPPYETYNQLVNKLDAFGNALIELENILPDLSVLPEGGDELPPPPFTLSMLYFCIPANEKMLEYWDRIADRLFKIRHCQNIDGVERSLSLFAPPIDPGMLVRAAASGLDLSSVLAGMNAPTPYYRFQVFAQKATELAQEVRSLGTALLQVLEKKDAEGMALLRSELELKVLNAVKDMKKLQIEEAKEQIEVLKRTRKVTEERDSYYSAVEKINTKEQLNLDKLSEANDYQIDSQIVRTVAGALALIPEFHVGASGFGGSPQVVMQLGGSAISRATTIGADILSILSSVATFEANRASIMGGYDRRFDEWKFQERLAKKELLSLDKQLEAADIRREIAETDLRNHELQIDNAKKTDEFMRSKFTNKELYDWMIGQVSSVYFSAYKLAHDTAKKAERSYRFELGNDDNFIAFGYWDSMKKGLQSADRLLHDIKRMEAAYLDKNKREYEITKQVSLVLLDPLALIRLRATGTCDFEIPEAVYDMDHPGQYFRRIKSVSVSLPCIAGPQTSVSAKVSLVNNRYRKNTNADNAAATGYLEDPGNDERFVYNVGAIQSIATSNAQNDSGVFELSFRDERYLPFEGKGAVSSWRLELPSEVRLFDYDTIADVVLHVKYTAREGGSSLKSLANASLRERLAVIKQQLSQEGLHQAIHLKHDLSNEWYLLKKNGTVDLTIDKSRLPYLAQTLDTAVEDVMFLAKVKNNPATFTLVIDGANLNLSRVDDWQLCRGTHSTIELDTPFTLSLAAAQLANLEEVMLVVKYSF